MKTQPTFMPTAMIPGALEPRSSIRVLEPAVPIDARVAVAAVMGGGESGGGDSRGAAERPADESVGSHGLLDPLRLGMLHLTEFVIRLLRTPARN